jgi:hypothetical protein
MRVVKGFDASEMKNTVPCEEMNRQRVDGDSNESGRCQRKDARFGGRETGQSCLLFRPWYG